MSRTIVLAVAVCVLAAGCGATWSGNFDDPASAIRTALAGPLAGHPYPDCVVQATLKDVPAQKALTDISTRQMDAILADCRDGVKDDRRTALGWTWDTVFYTIFGGNSLLMFLFGWELFFGLLPFAAGITLVQIAWWAIAG